VQSAELGEILDQVNDGYLGLTFNPMYDTTDHPERFFFRSDHINYARNGIPIAFFFSGVHEDYHRPSDHADKIDYEKMLKITRTIYASAWELAMRDGRPALNAELPEAIRR
jgi:Zn-dependent M28 family amino/carboxypeptidase